MRKFLRGHVMSCTLTPGLASYCPIKVPIGNEGDIVAEFCCMSRILGVKAELHFGTVWLLLLHVDVVSIVTIDVGWMSMG